MVCTVATAVTIKALPCGHFVPFDVYTPSAMAFLTVYTKQVPMSYSVVPNQLVKDSVQTFYCSILRCYMDMCGLMARVLYNQNRPKIHIFLRVTHLNLKKPFPRAHSLLNLE